MTKLEAEALLQIDLDRVQPGFADGMAIDDALLLYFKRLREVQERDFDDEDMTHEV